MTIIYVAFDGRQFQNKSDCEFYEWKAAHTLISRILLYDKDNNQINDYFSESGYNSIEKIIVPDEHSLQQFQELANYTGFCDYEAVTSIGTWIWNGNQFIKQEEEKHDTDTDENTENKNS